jgi:glucosamine kinase
MDEWFIGIDGGGTHTRAVVLDGEGHEVARAEGPAALADPRDPAAAAGPVAEVSASVAGAAGLALPCTALWAGIAGVGREPIRTAVEAAVQRAGLAGRVHVGTDARAAFHDAFGSGPGILLVSGTGSVAYGRDERGCDVRVGGWGSLLGDEGSGYWVGLESLRAVARAADGRGSATLLQERVPASIGVDGADALLLWSAAATKREVAALVPVVAEAAERGDTVAAGILSRAAGELAAHVVTLLDRMSPWREPPRVALTGGLLRPRGPLRALVEAHVTRNGLRLVDREPDPAQGAAKLARNLWTS